MLNIVIVCGGTGSIALQHGFDSLYGLSNYNMDIVINAYDNGKSTGVCRKVFDHSILGPSDLRKNQLTLFEIMYKKELQDKESYESKLLELFELRFSAEDYQDYYTQACRYIREAVCLSSAAKDRMQRWIDHFFYEDPDRHQIREKVINTEFTDFSLSNIFYASSASLNGGSLCLAGKELSEILGIRDKVHLISDVDLYLKAETESGYRIDDEADIVAWDNPQDRITRVILLDREGKEYTPEVDEKNSHSVKSIFEKADLIIFSSGTQWSSLIPTYMHKQFRELISRSKARKYLIMNNVEDHDMYGITADQMLDIIERYLDLKDITVVVNDNAEEAMRNVFRKIPVIHGRLSKPGDRKHIPEEIAKIIMKDYFELNQRYILVSDLDGTLWEEQGNDHEKEIGKKNLEKFNGIILSGNTFEHVSRITEKYYHGKEKIYCDYGNTYFYAENLEDRHRLSEEFLIEDELKDLLETYPEFQGKANLRGGVILTLKPLTDRKEKLRLINALMSEFQNKYEGRIAGRTSIDIVRKNFSKEASLNLILERDNIDRRKVLYIGNELNEGNEVCIRNTGVKALQVNDVFEMYIFLKTYNRIFNLE